MSFDTLHTLIMVMHNYFHSDQPLTIVQYIMDKSSTRLAPNIDNTLLNQSTLHYNRLHHNYLITAEK